MNKNLIEFKAPERAQLQDQIKAFLDKGNEIERVPVGKTKTNKDGLYGEYGRSPFL